MSRRTRQNYPLNALDGGGAASDAKRQRALRNWWIRLAGRETAPADILTLTDSIMESYNLAGSTGNYSRLERINVLLKQELLRRNPQVFGSGGEGYLPVEQTLGNGNTNDWPITKSGGATANSVGSIGLGSRGQLMSAAGQTITYNVTNATHVDVAYALGSGTFNVTVDGGTATLVTTTNGTIVDGKTFRVTLPDTGAHTIVLSWVSGSVRVGGFMHYNGDTARGIRYWEAGHAGGSTAYFVGSSRVLQQVSMVNPALVIIEIGANDQSGAVPQRTSLAQFRTNILQMISEVKSGSTVAPSFCLVKAWDLNTTGVTPSWGEYTSVLDSIANADPDVFAWDAQPLIRVGSPGNVAGGLLTDGSHLSRAGAFIFTKALAAQLTPS